MRFRCEERGLFTIRHYFNISLSFVIKEVYFYIFVTIFCIGIFGKIFLVCAGFFSNAYLFGKIGSFIFFVEIFYFSTLFHCVCSLFQ